MSDAENHTVPPAIHDSWRTWLMTGARRTPVDRRRLRGANKGLKKILLEGLVNGRDGTYRWQEFSGAMVRHAVDDAMRSLPPEETQVVKLAYFGGYSNREIAKEVGLTEGTVQRRLRRALGSGGGGAAGAGGRRGGGAGARPAAPGRARPPRPPRPAGGGARARARGRGGAGGEGGRGGGGAPGGGGGRAAPPRTPTPPP